MLIQLCFAFHFLYWNNYRCPFHKVLLLFFAAIVFVGEFVSNDTLMSVVGRNYYDLLNFPQKLIIKLNDLVKIGINSDL